MPSSAVQRTARSRSPRLASGTSGPVLTEDSYGRGPITRELTALRGEVRSGDSGGPLVVGAGNVMGTVFAATTQGKPGGYTVPNDAVAKALSDSTGEVGTGPCTGETTRIKPALPGPYDR